MSIFAKYPEWNRIREQQEAFRRNVAHMNTVDPLPPYRPRSPSPPTERQILQEIEDVALDDPEMLQKLQAISRKVPIPIMSAAERKYYANERKRLDRRIEDRRIAEKEVTARWLDEMHANQGDTLFGYPRKNRGPAPNYGAAVAREKAALQRKRLEDEAEEVARAKEQGMAPWRDTRSTSFGVPYGNKNPPPEYSAQAGTEEKAAEQPKRPDQQIEDEAGAEETGPPPLDLDFLTDLMFHRHPQAKAQEDDADARAQKDNSKDKGMRKRIIEGGTETVPWDIAQNEEDHGSPSRKRTRTDDTTGDSPPKADSPAQSHTGITAEDQVIAPELSTLSSAESLDSSAAMANSSVPESEPEVVRGEDIEKEASVGSSSTIASTSSSQHESHAQRAGEHLDGGLDTGAKDGH
ncbi:MAG: hypothetical protein Q9195_006660 [Heterodermia aff. obscurata]